MFNCVQRHATFLYLSRKSIGLGYEQRVSTCAWRRASRRRAIRFILYEKMRRPRWVGLILYVKIRRVLWVGLILYVKIRGPLWVRTLWDALGRSVTLWGARARGLGVPVWFRVPLGWFRVPLGWFRVPLARFRVPGRLAWGRDWAQEPRMSANSVFS